MLPTNYDQHRSFGIQKAKLPVQGVSVHMCAQENSHIGRTPLHVAAWLSNVVEGHLTAVYLYRLVSNFSTKKPFVLKKM